MSRLVNMDRRSRLNFRKAVRLSVFHSAEVNVGHSNLGGKVRVFGILDVYTAIDASSAASGWLGSPRTPHLRAHLALQLLCSTLG
jgi:hypothetical protein